MKMHYEKVNIHFELHLAQQGTVLRFANTFPRFLLTPFPLYIIPLGLYRPTNYNTNDVQ